MRLLPLLVVVLLAGCGAAPAKPAGVDLTLQRPVPSGLPVCPPSGVKIETGQAEAAMGLRVMPLRLLNCGDGPLRLDGHPDIRLFDEQEQQLTVDVLEGSGGITSGTDFDAPPREFTLEPGQSATSGLLWRNTYDDPSVPSETARRLEVALGPEADWQAVLTPAEPLNVDLGNTGRVGVRAWTPMSR